MTKTNEQKFEERLDERAEKFDRWWHSTYPSGMMVSPYSNQDVPEICFRNGAHFGYQQAISDVLEKLRAEAKECRSLIHECAGLKNLARKYDETADWLEREMLGDEK